MSRRKEFNFARLLPALVPAVLFALIAATSAYAAPTVSVDTVTLTSSATGVTNNVVQTKAAVCSGNVAEGLDVDATFSTGSFSPAGPTVSCGSLSTCADHNTSTAECNALPTTDLQDACNASTGNKYQIQACTSTTVDNKRVDASASDGTNGVALGASSNLASQSGTMPISGATADGLLTTTVTATAKEDQHVTSYNNYKFWTGNNCTGTPSEVAGPASGPVDSTVSSSPAMNSAMYYLDIEGPNFTSNTAIENLDPTMIPLGDPVDLNVEIEKGSACTMFSLTGTTDPALGSSPQSLPTEQFGIGNNLVSGMCSDVPPAIGNGIAVDYMKATALSFATECGTDPAGAYELFAEAYTKDLCGDTNGIDPFPSPDGLPFSLVGGGAGLDGKTKVLAPIGPSGQYAHVKCFNAQLGPTTRKGKKAGLANTNPGTLHIGELVLFDSCGSSDPLPEIKLLLKAPSPWEYLKTGNSPQAHVFKGPAGVMIDLHHPEITNAGDGWVEITDQVTFTLPDPDNVIKIVIPDTVGVLPTDAVYVRAHLFYNSGLVYSSTDYYFSSKVSIPDFLEKDWSSKKIVGNPTYCDDGYVCVNGLKSYGACVAAPISATSTKKLKARRRR